MVGRFEMAKKELNIIARIFVLSIKLPLENSYNFNIFSVN